MRIVAADRGVRVFTVAFGSKDGAEIPGTYGGWSFWARVDEEALKTLVRDGEIGAVFRKGDVEDLFRTLKRLLLDEALRSA